MRKVLSVIASGILAFTLIGCSGNTELSADSQSSSNSETEQSNTKKFSIYGLSIDYPSDWEASQTGESTYTIKAPFSGSVVVQALSANESIGESLSRDDAQRIAKSAQSEDYEYSDFTLANNEGVIKITQLGIGIGEKSGRELNDVLYLCDHSIYRVIGVTLLDATIEQRAAINKVMDSAIIDPAIQVPKSASENSNSGSASASSSSNSSVPREYQSALAAARQYLSTMAFSKQGLYDQLTSEYGNGFPAEAAQYAVDNCNADWNAEALESARNYLKMMPMSDKELYEQLTSEYGEQFTPEQAQYAIDHLD